jgi:hypothetical protein
VTFVTSQEGRPGAILYIVKVHWGMNGDWS